MSTHRYRNAAVLFGLAALASSADLAHAGSAAKRVNVAFSNTPVLGAVGTPTCAPAGCVLVVQPGTSTFTGDITAKVTASQTVVLSPARRPAAVSVIAVVDGTVKGCGAGSFLMQSVFDYKSLPKGVASKGTWTVVPGSATGGLAGASGGGTVNELMNALGVTKEIAHSGTFSCSPA